MAQQPVSPESRVKAAFLYRFPGFVEWPPQALEERKSLDICVLGPSPFGTVLEELVAGEALAGRVLRARRVNARGANTCHVLYFPEGADRRRNVLRTVAGQPVLTVSDAEGFLEDGGIIQLWLADDRVRFNINVDAADRAGLRLSAQLLRLAVRVIGGVK